MWQKTNLITPSDITASDPRCRVIGTFNPGAVRIDDTVHLLVRVAEQPLEPAAEHVGLPRFDQHGQLHIDRYHRDQLHMVDARVAVIRETGIARLTSVSHLRHFTVAVDALTDPAAYVPSGNRFWPAGGMETQGVEDPRITRIGGRYYITYVAVSDRGVCTALASTTDFRHFKRHGVIFPCENKDVLLFPERLQGRYFALHRPVPATPLGKPEMWIAQSDDLRAWGDHRVLVEDAIPQEWAGGRVGGGTPPVATDAGWASLYHASERPRAAGQVGRYCGGGILFNPQNPTKIVAISPQPILVPDHSFETVGFVPQVVFPTAWIDVGTDVGIFYGAADTSTAIAIANRQTLLQSFHQ